MTRDLIAVALLLVSLCVCGVSRVDAATNNYLFSDVSVIGQEWFKNSTYLARGFFFRAESEGYLPGDPEHRYPRCQPNRPDAYAQGFSPLIMPVSTSTSREEFIYRVKVRSNADKVIKAILWDYVFIDPQTNADLERHTFYSDIRLKPGKAKLLEATSPKPPTRVIPIRLLLSDGSSAYREQVEIKAIVFADGSSEGAFAGASLVAN